MRIWLTGGDLLAVSWTTGFSTPDGFNSVFLWSPNYKALLSMCKQTSDKKPTFSVRLVRADAGSDGQRIDNFLIRECKGVPKSHLYKAIRSGQVRVNKGRVQAEYRVKDGDEIRIPPLRVATPDEKRVVPAGQFPIVFEDDALIVIDKPSGVAVHGGSGVSFGVIEQMRAARPEARFLELAHRLDKETSGLLIIAKKRAALVALHGMFKESRGRKCYLALVEGDWVNDRQHIRLPLEKYLTRDGERRVRVRPEGKAAHTIVSKEARFGRYTLVKAELRTGRTHQIRVHLAASGFPIVGDEKYGNDETRIAFARQGFARMFLHAHTLEIPHPVTQEPLSLTAPLPDVCRQLLDRLAVRR